MVVIVNGEVAFYVLCSKAGCDKDGVPLILAWGQVCNQLYFFFFGQVNLQDVILNNMPSKRVSSKISQLL